MINCEIIMKIKRQDYNLLVPFVKTHGVAFSDISDIHMFVETHGRASLRKRALRLYSGLARSRFQNLHFHRNHRTFLRENKMNHR